MLGDVKKQSTGWVRAGNSVSGGNQQGLEVKEAEGRASESPKRRKHGVRGRAADEAGEANPGPSPQGRRENLPPGTPALQSQAPPLCLPTCAEFTSFPLSPRQTVWTFNNIFNHFVPSAGRWKDTKHSLNEKIIMIGYFNCLIQQEG